MEKKKGESRGQTKTHLINPQLVLEAFARALYVFTLIVVRLLMRGEPFTENFRLLQFAAPTCAVLTRQRDDQGLVLPGAITEPFEVVVEAINLFHGFARRFHVPECQH